MPGSNSPPVLISVAALDASFSGDGRTSVPIGNGDDRCRSIAVQANGDYVVAGWSVTGSGGSDFAVLRFKPDGTLDTTFSADGRQTTDIGGSDQAYGVAIQPDGHIVVIGTTDFGTTSDIVVARYNLDGSLDTTFSNDGKLTTSLSDGVDEATAVAIQSDGKILVLAASDTQAFATARLVLVRYNPDGTLDTTFANNGMPTANFDYFESATAMALQEDGRILVAGYVWSGSEYDLVAARFNANGSLDVTFSDDGLLQIDTGSSADLSAERAMAVAVQQDGRILLGGTLANGATSDALLIRLTSSGTLDGTFGGGDGIVTLDRSNTDTFNSIAVQADGQIVAAGSQATGVGEAVLARFNADGTLDSTFNGTGVYSAVFASGTSAIYDLAFSPSGQIVAVGDSFTGTYDFGVFRLADGVIDKSVIAGAPFAYGVSSAAFYDANGDLLTYSATQTNGTGLPTWLSFDPVTRTFAGTPQDGDFGTTQIRLLASDGVSSVATQFQIEVSTSFIEALRFTNHFRWNPDSPNGTPGTTLSFSFMEATPSYASALESATFAVMSLAQRQAVRDVFHMYSEMAGLNFIEVADTNGGGQLQFGDYNEAGTSQSAYTSSVFSSTQIQSAIWVNRAFAGYETPIAGNDPYQTLIHEIGHALGLKHPGNYGGGVPPFLPVDQDTTQYTVMSYVGRTNSFFLDVQGTSPANYLFDYYTVSASTAMLYDIATVQFLYGANASTQAGDTVYGFDPVTPFFKTLWDGGGIDTLSLANFSTENIIDLRPGHFSSIRVLPDSLPPNYTGTAPSYDGSNNLAIAYGVVIENVLGGSGNDTMLGNSANNILTGGAGNDSIDGGDGVDDAVYSDSKSAYAISQTSAISWTVVGPDGTDTLSNIERLMFADQVFTLVETNTARNVDVLAYSWKAHTLLDGVSIIAGTTPAIQATDASGGTRFVGVTDTNLPITASRTVPSDEIGGTDQAVNLQDAIAILKMIVGLDVNGAGKPLSPYQAFAADFDGNGTVGLTDAIGVLKHVVGLPSPDPQWLFFDEVDATVPGKANLTPGSMPAIASDLSAAAAQVRVGLVGVLRGDVDGSFLGTAGAQDLDATQGGYFQNLAAIHHLNPSQFGIYDV